MVSVVDIIPRRLMVSVVVFLMVSVVAGNVVCCCLLLSFACFMVSVVVCFLWFLSWQETVVLWFPSRDFWWILPPQEDPYF